MTPQPNRASNRNMNPVCWDEEGKEKPSRFALSGLPLCPILLRTGPTEDINHSSDSPATTESHSFQLTHFFSLRVAFYIFKIA